MIILLVLGLSLLGLVLAVGIDVLTNPVNREEWREARVRRSQEQIFAPKRRHAF